MEFCVEVPGEDYWKRQIRCQHACQVDTDARGYVPAMAEGNDELGLSDRARSESAGVQGVGEPPR